NVEEAEELQRPLAELMYRASFNLTKWSSNSEEVLEGIDEKDRDPSTLVDLSERQPMKALGIHWDTTRDLFKFQSQPAVMYPSAVETKLSLLSVASKLFDPMGFITPYTVRAKILL
ncbi:predicted protein, partial [Nematostella vectensis]